MPSSEDTAGAAEQRLATAAALLGQLAESIDDLAARFVATSSRQDLRVLGHLSAHPAQRPADLKSLTGLSRPGVAAVVARLERLGLVERVVGEVDHRTRLASLTADGTARMAELELAFDARLENWAADAVAIVDLLGGEVPRPTRRPPDDTIVAVICRMQDAMEAFAARLDESVRSLHPRQRVALVVLMSWGLSRPTHLARALRLSSGGLTYVMNHLEAEGFVVRSYGQDDDRRAVLVQLSESGLACGRSICTTLEASASELCAALAGLAARRPRTGG